jgi:hypothetical protein
MADKTEIKIVRYGDKIYLKQESTSGDSRGNRYLGPFRSPQQLEIFGHRAILKAKLFDLRDQEADED